MYQNHQCIAISVWHGAIVEALAASKQGYNTIACKI